MTYYLSKSNWYNSLDIPEGMNLDMLNMPGRLDLLLKPAIDKINKNKVFVDLGCGTGILGLYALQQGAKFVYFVEQNDQMIHILKNILPEKIQSKKYKIVHSDIENLTNSDFDQHEPEIFVSEFYGPRLFDEGYVNYTKHLRTLFPNCFFIPSTFSGKFYLGLVDYNQPIWPHDIELLDHFKFMYREKGFARYIDKPDEIKSIGNIYFDANKQEFNNHIEFQYKFKKDSILIGVMNVEHGNLKQEYTHIGWFLDKKDYNKKFKIYFDEVNYFNPIKEIL